MNDYLLSLMLGVVEGVTEFLPVSSTAHLRIFEALAGVHLADGYWKMFTIVIQLGAILCLPIYFRTRIADFLGSFPRGRQGDRRLLPYRSRDLADLRGGRHGHVGGNREHAGRPLGRKLAGCQHDGRVRPVVAKVRNHAGAERAR